MTTFFRLSPPLLDEIRDRCEAAAPPRLALTATRFAQELVRLDGSTVWRGGVSAPITLPELARRLRVTAASVARHLGVLRRAGVAVVRRLGRRGVSIALPILARVFEGRAMPPVPAPRPQARELAPKAPSTPPSPPVRREPDPAPSSGKLGRIPDDARAVSEADLDRAVAQREREHDALRPDGRRERPPIRDRRAWRAAVRRGLRADPEALREALARADAREAEAERARRAREARQAEGARALDAASSARQVLERDRAERAAAWASYQALGADERARVDAEAWAKVPDPASPLAASRHRAAVEAIMRARRGP